MRKRPGPKRWLDAGTMVLVAVALGVLFHDRILPAWRSREVVSLGERVPDRLRYRALASGDTLSLGPGAPTLHLVFQSGCPACRENLPAWRSLLAGARGLRAFAVGLEAPETALAYVRAELATALAVRPLDPRAYVRILRITAVPTTLLLDAEGRLVWHRSGRLSDEDLASLLTAATSSRGPETSLRSSAHPSHPNLGRTP